MSLELPAALAELAKLAHKDVGRYAMNNIRLIETHDGFRAEATDGRRLAVVTGPGLEEDVLPLLRNSPNGASEALIPAKEWKDAFKLSKLSKDGKIHCVMGPTSTAFGAGTQFLQTPNGEGRWPNFVDVIPSKPPICEIVIDANLFAELVDVAGAFSPSDHGRPNGHVTIRYWSPDKPICLISQNGREHFLGLIMPCVGTPAPVKPELEETEEEVIEEESPEPEATVVQDGGVSS